MKTGKKLIMTLIIILIIVLIALGGFAYIYLATDILKTDKEMFFSYFSQITEKDEFIDSRLEMFSDKKRETPYENSGEIKIKVNYPNELSENIAEKVNDMVIKFSGKIDSKTQKLAQNIEVDYGNDTVFPISYKQDGNKYGLQINKLLKKFIAIRNEELDSFLKSLDNDNNITLMSSRISGLVDVINPLLEMYKNTDFSDEEINQLKEIYGTVLEKQMIEENFSVAKLENGESYTLDLSNEQVKNIIVKMVEATKQNTLIIDKLNEVFLEIYPSAEKMEITQLDEIITSINEVDTSDIPNIKLTLVQKDKLLQQIILEVAENKIVIEKSIDGYNVNIESKTSTEYNCYFKVQYAGLETLENIEEKYQFGLNLNSDGEQMRYDYEINNNIVFNNDIVIEGLNKNNAVFLNDYTSEQLMPFLTQLGTKILEVNKEQMTKLGLKEYENPLLYSNPMSLIILTALQIYQNAEETVEKTDLSIYEIQQYNNKFEKYVGEELSGSVVNMLIQTALNHNLLQVDNSTKVAITGEVELSTNDANQEISVPNDKKYNIEAIYNNQTGLITELKITSSN